MIKALEHDLIHYNIYSNHIKAKEEAENPATE
jgi:hypothetical protein